MSQGPGPGWYPDPTGNDRLRWWDGSGWTTRVGDTTGQQPQPPDPQHRPRRRGRLATILGLLAAAAVAGGAIGAWVVDDGRPQAEQVAPDAETDDRLSDGGGEAAGAGRAGVAGPDQGARWVSHVNGDHVRDVAPAPDGGVWTAGAGVRRWGADGKLEEVYQSEHGLASNAVSSIAVAPDGTVWVGTWDAGLSRFDGRQWTTYTVDDGLADNVVWSVAVGLDGTVWAGTDAGLSRFDPDADT